MSEVVKGGGGEANYFSLDNQEGMTKIKIPKWGINTNRNIASSGRPNYFLLKKRTNQKKKQENRNHKTEWPDSDSRRKSKFKKSSSCREVELKT